MTGLRAYDFSLPERCIATRPADPVESARLMELPRQGPVCHHHVKDLPSLLPPRSLLIANNTKVVPARLQGQKTSGGRLELLPVRATAPNKWLTLIKGNLKPGDVFDVHGQALTFLGRRENGLAEVDIGKTNMQNLMAEFGEVPLPPYIERVADEQDREQYQTTFASAPGAVAAPTAGLHFSGNLKSELIRAGHRLETITLHVGPGTFLPVRADNPLEHRVLGEEAEVSPEVHQLIKTWKAAHRPVIAIGTTVTRTLEYLWRHGGGPGFRGEVALTISPPYSFRCVDHLLTNFHLPQSSLLLLASAFSGRRRLLEAYREAVELEYRFYSYGDLTFLR